jgi:hypothetical protein
VSYRLATSWTVRGSYPGGGEIFRTRPDRPCGLPSLLYNGYRVSFLEVKRPGCGVDHPPSSSARVKERVELYLYFPSGPSWPVLGRTLPLPCVLHAVPNLYRLINIQVFWFLMPCFSVHLAPDISKDCSAFVSTVKQSESLWTVV